MFEEIEGCIFDLDGTLLDSMQVWQDVDRRFLEKYGLEWNPEISQNVKKMTLDESALYFIHELKVPISLNQIKAEWESMVADEYYNNIQLKPGAMSIVKQMYACAHKMTVATSCNRGHAIAAMNRLKISRYFEYVKTVKDVGGKSKKYPDLFYYCAKAMDTDVDRTIVFEDLLLPIKVAHEAGFVTCAIQDELSAHEKEEIMKYSDYYFKSFKDIFR